MVPDNQIGTYRGPAAARLPARGEGKERGSMNGLVTVLRAADAAARWHVNQRRKGAAQEPYVTHLLEVAMLVAEATAGADPNLIVGGRAKLTFFSPGDGGALRHHLLRLHHNPAQHRCYPCGTHARSAKAHLLLAGVDH